MVDRHIPEDRARFFYGCISNYFYLSLLIHEIFAQSQEEEFEMNSSRES